MDKKEIGALTGRIWKEIQNAARFDPHFMLPVAVTFDVPKVKTESPLFMVLKRGKSFEAQIIGNGSVPHCAYAMRAFNRKAIFEALEALLPRAVTGLMYKHDGGEVEEWSSDTGRRVSTIRVAPAEYRLSAMTWWPSGTLLRGAIGKRLYVPYACALAFASKKQATAAADKLRKALSHIPRVGVQVFNMRSKVLDLNCNPFPKGKHEIVAIHADSSDVWQKIRLEVLPAYIRGSSGGMIGARSQTSDTLDSLLSDIDARIAAYLDCLEKTEVLTSRRVTQTRLHVIQHLSAPYYNHFATE